MSSDVKIRFCNWIPGAGFNSSGNPKQGKTRVVGVISVTSYTAGGEPLTPTDLKLSTIDAITLRPQDEVASDGAQFRRVALYNQTNDLFYLATIQEDGVVDEYALAATETVEFIAEGDSAHDVELLTS